MYLRQLYQYFCKEAIDECVFESYEKKNSLGEVENQKI